ncbi:MAG: transposase [Phycisphaerae bacterium]
MRIAVTGKLFNWESLDDSPDLVACKLLLGMLSDEKIIGALRFRRYKGRDDYPVPMLWRVHLLRYFLRHATMELCLAEMRRNPALRELAFIPTVADVPKPWNMSRFEEVLGEPVFLALLREMFEQLIRKLGSVVPDLGRHTAGDSSCLSARGDSKEACKNDSPLPQPTGGRKEYRSDDGQVSKVYEWFGYKFHLLVDVRHEVILAWHITAATESDAGQIPELVQQAQGNLPAGRTETLAYDKAADDVIPPTAKH